MKTALAYIKASVLNSFSLFEAQKMLSYIQPVLTGAEKSQE